MRTSVEWVTGFIDVPQPHQDATERAWAIATHSTLSEHRENGQFVTLIPPSGPPFLRVQGLKYGEARVHLDLHSADPTALRDRAVELGGTAPHRKTPNFGLLSPGGVRWCSVAPQDEYPGAPAAPGTVHVTMEIPAAAYEVELSFWRNLTEWDTEPTDEGSILVLHTPLPIIMEFIPTMTSGDSRVTLRCSSLLWPNILASSQCLPEGEGHG